jgi:hypothetical protein
MRRQSGISGRLGLALAETLNLIEGDLVTGASIKPLKRPNQASPNSLGSVIIPTKTRVDRQAWG